MYQVVWKWVLSMAVGAVSLAGHTTPHNNTQPTDTHTHTLSHTQDSNQLLARVTGPLGSHVSTWVLRLQALAEPAPSTADRNEKPCWHLNMNSVVQYSRITTGAPLGLYYGEVIIPQKKGKGSVHCYEANYERMNS